MTTCSTPGCTAPLGLPCHSCGTPVCWEHIHASFLVAHCASCWNRDHAREATAQQRAVATPARSLAPAVGDVVLLPGPDGRHLLVVDVWRAEPPATLGRATCLLGTWTPPATFTPVVPHQSALFGFAGTGDLPFERVGGIDLDVAHRIHRDGQTLLAAATAASGVGA
jgi:hypothetical protein